MHTRLRLLSAALAVLLAARADAQTARPTLVVAMTVDQLRPDHISTWASQLTGGFARLWQEGAFFANGYQDHANTETAPGHASVLSGRFPLERLDGRISKEVLR